MFEITDFINIFPDIHSALEMLCNIIQNTAMQYGKQYAKNPIFFLTWVFQAY